MFFLLDFVVIGYVRILERHVHMARFMFEHLAIVERLTELIAHSINQDFYFFNSPIFSLSFV